MKILELLAEGRLTTASGLPYVVLHNPSRRSFEAFTKRYEVLRGLLTYRGDDVWLWDGGVAVHTDVIDQLGLQYVDCIFYNRGRWQGDVSGEGGYGFRPAIQRLTPYRPPPRDPRQEADLDALVDEYGKLFGDQE